MILTHFLHATVGRKNPNKSKYGHDSCFGLALAELPLGIYFLCSPNFLT